ncbi:hypothetical protein BX600DRAFT_504504 [Xylariales sp. PMI_506]|nr:hypothetical protein BX600DRAFT_504504 [Xylariales sp. PMI_506]
MQQTFRFVDGVQVDKSTRKLMRSHVMKGKNAGKKFHRPSRLEASKRGQQQSMVLAWPPAKPLKPHEFTSPLHLSPSDIVKNVGNILCTLQAPIVVEPVQLRIIQDYFVHIADKMYPPRLVFSAGDAMYHWLNLMLSDEESAKCCISLMETSNEFFATGGVSSKKALNHLSRSFALVKKRLESDQALSNSSISIVLSFIFQEQMRHDRENAKIHYEGLRRMVELRGGIDKLEDTLPLLLKICKIEATFTLQYGGRMLFFRDRMPDMQKVLESQGVQFEHNPDICATYADQLDPALAAILLDMMKVSTIYRRYPYNIKVGVITFQEILVSFCSRLNHFHQMPGHQLESKLDSAMFIGMTVFTMSLFLRHDHRRILHYKPVTDYLKMVVNTGSDSSHNELILWLLLIGGIWLYEDDKESWILSELRTFSRRMGSKSWDEIHTTIIKFPWVERVHDEAGLDVWVMANRET